jgi:hypothetical protein
MTYRTLSGLPPRLDAWCGRLEVHYRDLVRLSHAPSDPLWDVHHEILEFGRTYRRLRDVLVDLYVPRRAAA